MEEIKLHQFREKLELFGYAARTVEAYVNETAQFFQYLKDKENLSSLADLQISHVKAWQAWLTFEKFSRAGSRANAQRLTAGTVTNRLVAVKTFFKTMHQEGLLPYDYSHRVIVPKKRKPLPRNIPTVEEMRRLLQTAVPDNPLGIRDRFIMELLYATGIRSCELRTLSVYDFNIQERVLYIRGKGNKDRMAPVGNWVIPYALEYLHAARPWLVRTTKTQLLFCCRNGQMLDSSMLHKIVTMYREKAGFTTKLSPHTFRHACATHMLQAGADIRYVQELLGHSDLSSTQIYTRVSIGDLKQAHEKFHPANRDDF
jgi:integrase/recombinase XerD